MLGLERVMRTTRGSTVLRRRAARQELRGALVGLMLTACGPDDLGTPSGTDDPDQPDPTHGIAVSIAPIRSVRDLVATSERGDASLRWAVDGVDSGIDGPVVPAHLVRPGETWTVTATLGGDTGSASLTVPEPPGGNVLILVLDDIGVDHVGAYGLNDLAPPTPRIDALAKQGVRFDRAYSSPVCSPTRGILLTGRHARRTGLGWIADTGTRDFALPLASTTIAEALEHGWPAPWATSAVGKWHVAGPQAEGVLTHPNDQGFEWFAGTVGNPSYQAGYGYWRWFRNVNGVVEESFTYLTTATVDDALERAAAMPEPWLLYVGFHAAHTPLSPPPAELITREVTADDPQDVLFDATVEALDTEIGRLLDSLDPALLARTTVMVVGDNGTPAHAVDPPLDPDAAKHTVYEGGVRVPLILTGPHVARPGSVSDALVHVADVFVTTAEIVGVPLTGPDDALALDLDPFVPLDGRSLLPQLDDPDAPGRALLYTEAFFPNGPGETWSINRRSLRDDRYKLIRRGVNESLHDLAAGHPLDDGPDLLLDLPPEAQQSYRALSEALDELDATLRFEGY